MKAKVVSIEDKTFEKDGKSIPGVSVTFEAEGKTESRISWIPPVASTALQWKPGDEVEVEFYTDKKDRAAFKIPGLSSTGSKGLSFDERLALDRYQHERMDRRTALMQAVVFVGADADTILDLAGQFYKWLRKTSEPTTARGSDNAGTGVKDHPPAPVPAPSSGSGPGAEGKNQEDNKAAQHDAPSSSSRGGISAAPSEVVDTATGPTLLGEGGEGPVAAHSHTFTAEPFEYDGRSIPVRKGWEVCTGCLDARRAA